LTKKGAVNLYEMEHFSKYIKADLTVIASNGRIHIPRGGAPVLNPAGATRLLNRNFKALEEQAWLRQ
jgi:hypothetical protein